MRERERGREREITRLGVDDKQQVIAVTYCVRSRCSGGMVDRLPGATASQSTEQVAWKPGTHDLKQTSEGSPLPELTPGDRYCTVLRTRNRLHPNATHDILEMSIPHGFTGAFIL